MSYQPIHLVCFLDLNGVAQAEGSQEQLLTALGRSEGGLVTSLMPCTSQHLVVIFAYAYFKTKNTNTPSQLLLYLPSQELTTKP